MKKVIHLLSGGLDSVTMLYWLRDSGIEVHCLSIDYGQPHVQELDSASWHCARFGVDFLRIKAPRLGGLTNGNWVVPNRNAILISLAVANAVILGADSVTIGCNADDAAMFPDCRMEFIEAMNKAAKAAGYAVDVLAPFIANRKSYIAGLAREIGVPLAQTWSCYRGGSEPCGTCPACVKLKEALG